jgi:hypothetical protein
MDDFLVAGPADNAEEALALMRATAIASFGEAVRDLARQNFGFCSVHRRAVPRPAPKASEAPIILPDSAHCICPPPDAGAPDPNAAGPTPPAAPE